MLIILTSDFMLQTIKKKQKHNVDFDTNSLLYQLQSHNLSQKLGLA